MGLHPTLAVVGSGPAAFYTSLKVMGRIPTARVDMFEKLPVPFGLVRSGVAPDHPEVKNVQDRFSQAAESSLFRFFGNCEIGRDIALEKLVANYDAVLLAYGVQKDRRLGIPGEQTLENVVSARQFVGWYNGDPEFRDLDMKSRLKRATHATIVGNGNVAMDIARVLLREPKEWQKTDMITQAARDLGKSNVRHIEIVGRRGLMSSAFGIKELRELQKEPHTRMMPVKPSSILKEQLTARQDERKAKLLREPWIREEEKKSQQEQLEKKSNLKEESKAAQAEAAQAESEPKKSKSKTWRLSFLRSPKAFVSDDHGRLTGVEWQINELNEEKRAVPTGRTEFQATDLVFTSIGTESLPLTGMKDLGIQFDSKRGRLPRKYAQVPANEDNIFAAGWVTTGAEGKIATTYMDAMSVGEEIGSFLEKLEHFKEGLSGLELPDHRLVSWHDWERIDQEELARGHKAGKDRVKFLTAEEITEWLDKENVEKVE